MSAPDTQGIARDRRHPGRSGSRRLRLFAAVLVALLTAACDPRPYAPPEVRTFVHATQVPRTAAAVDDLPQATLTVVTGPLSHVIAVRVAATPEARTQGLRGVPALASGTGLLALSPADLEGPLTLEDYDMPIDLAFLDPDGEIVKIHSGLPCQTVPCTAYDAGRPYRAILQMEGGWFAGHQVAEGDRVAADSLPAAS